MSLPFALPSFASTLVPSSTTPAFGFVLLAVIVLVFHFYLNVLAASGNRYKLIDQQFIDKNLKEEDEELKKVFGSGVPLGGHPDAGLGRFFAKLPIAKWYEHNLQQRVVANYQEMLVTIVFAVLVCGLFNPHLGATFGFLHVLGRVIYGFGFRPSSPGARAPGFMICVLTTLGAVLSASFYSLRMTGVLDQYIGTLVKDL